MLIINESTNLSLRGMGTLHTYDRWVSWVVGYVYYLHCSKNERKRGQQSVELSSISTAALNWQLTLKLT